MPERREEWDERKICKLTTIASSTYALLHIAIDCDWAASKLDHIHALTSLLIHRKEILEELKDQVNKMQKERTELLKAQMKLIQKEVPISRSAAEYYDNLVTRINEFQDYIEYHVDIAKTLRQRIANVIQER